jgi:hypothetical protein
VVNTAFCKSITIGRVSNVITSGVDTAKFFSVQVDGLPSYSSNTVSSLNTTATAIYPAKVTLTGYNSSVYNAALRSLPAGVYTYAAIVVDPSSLEYAISYTAGFRFQVIKSAQSLLAPSIHSVVFYSDGSHLIISFDCHTNGGNTLATLNCNTLFQCKCASSSLCQWMVDATVFAYLAGSSCTVPNGNFSIRSYTSITAHCLAMSNYTKQLQRQ